MRNKIVLACIQCGSRNYTTAKNMQSMQERLVVNKFCKECNAHTEHRETK